MVDEIQVQFSVTGEQLVDGAALPELFDQHRLRLRRLIQLRLDRRLQARIDPSDVLQEAYLDISRRIGQYVAEPRVPLYVWMRFLTEQRLMAIHRQHLGAQQRDARMEESLGGGSPDGTSLVAVQLVAQLTSPSSVAMRIERVEQLRVALTQLSDTDQEILVLRHFEELSNDEVASVLDIKKNAASNRYMRAIERLRNVLESVPGFLEK